jgi:hypothetical protein
MTTSQLDAELRSFCGGEILHFGLQGCAKWFCGCLSPLQRKILPMFSGLM